MTRNLSNPPFHCLFLISLLQFSSFKNALSCLLVATSPPMRRGMKGLLA